MSMIRVYVADLLHTPLPDLSPPRFDAWKLTAPLPRFCDHLKLIYGLQALEPLAKRPETENFEALLYAVHILGSFGLVVSRVPDPRLSVFISASTLALNGLPPENEQPPVYQTDLIRRPDYFSQLLLAEWRCLHYAKSIGYSDEIVRCVAGLILAVWEFADELQRSPGKGAVALFREKYWSKPTTAAILRNLQLELCDSPNFVALMPSTQAARTRGIL